MFDAGPPPKLWMPSRPAIIRAASRGEFGRAGILPGIGAPLGGLAGKSLTETLVGQGVGTVIENMTANGAGKAFDGNTAQGQNSGAARVATSGYNGKDWGASTTKLISKAVVWPSNDNGFCASESGNITVELHGHSSAPSNGTEGTILANLSIADTTASQTLTSSNQTAFRYHWIYVTNASATVCNIAEINFYELV